jgi:hypothetical protein
MRELPAPLGDGVFATRRVRQENNTDGEPMKRAAGAARMVALVAIASALIACGGDGGGSGGDSEAPSEPTARLSLSFTPESVKTFRFSWADTAGETEYRLLENPDGISGYTPVARIAADVTTYDYRAFLPGRINASYVLQACNNAGCIDSLPVYVDDSLTAAIGYVKAHNTGAGDSFGWTVALSADGSTLAVGAFVEDSASAGINGDATDDSAQDSGAVYVFTRSNGVWSQQAYVKAANADPGDEFGTRVALSADGDTLAVGAPREDSSATGVDGDATDDSATDSGAVYVFGRDGDDWTQRAYIKPAVAGEGDQFGFSIALAADGAALAVGAPLEDSAATGIDGDASDDSAGLSGAAYVFARDGGIWSQQAYVKPVTTGAGDRFGSGVALAGDGATLAVGAPFEDSAATGIDGDASDDSADSSGAAYVFVRDDDSWVQQAYVKSSATDANDFFGSRVALAADGDTLAVGATGDDSAATGINGDAADNSTPLSGAAYVFSRNDGTWAWQAYLKAANTGAGDRFGASVTLAADGDTLAVGAEGEGSPATGIDGATGDDNATRLTGAVYVFARRGGVWRQQAYVKATDTDANDQFGGSVALAADGATLAVGSAPEDSAATGIGGDAGDNSAADSGAVYLY